jgi:hypothetical protein
VGEFIAFVLLWFAWTPVLLVVHELGHAFAALLLTDGEVSIGMRARPMPMGTCTYDPACLRRPRAEAWIMAAGPAASLVAAIALFWGSLEAGLGATEGAFTHVLLVGSGCALMQFVVTALPVHYGEGIVDGGADSDGRAMWRILTGAPPGGLARAERELGRPQRTMHPVLMVLLAAIFLLTMFVDPTMVLSLAALFGAAWLLQRSSRTGG